METSNEPSDKSALGSYSSIAPYLYIQEKGRGVRPKQILVITELNKISVYAEAEI
jgi:hypothetical protein